jgi:shikimate kinase
MCNKKEKENQILSNKKIFTLIGMMGTGKSKFGRLVANNLAYKFYDVDTLIESDQKSTIKTIFQEKGESFFRKIEKNTIKNLIANVTTKEEKSILSLGGGAFDDQETRDRLLSNTYVIWLNTPVDILVKRVGNGSKRPMLKGDVNASINDLLSKRISYYSTCHYQLNTHDLSENQILNKLLTKISNKKSN